MLKNPFRILCAVDASPPAAAAFEQALAMSAHRGAQLVIVHAVSKDRPTVGVPWNGCQPWRRCVNVQKPRTFQ